MIGTRLPNNWKLKKSRIFSENPKHRDIDWMLFSELDQKLSARLYWQFSCRMYSYFGTYRGARAW